jgi:SSS family solute:Na+ symporter
VLRVARGAALTGGALGVAFAIVATSIVDGLLIFYTLLGVCLFVPILAGLFLRRVGTPEATGAVVAGVGVTVIVHLLTSGRGYGLFSPALAGFAASAAVVGLLLLVTPGLRPPGPGLPRGS